MKGVLKMKKLISLLLVLFVFCCESGAAEKQPSKSLVRMNPALTGIDQVYVSVEPGEIGADENIQWQRLKRNIEKQLKQAGIKVAEDIHYEVDVRLKKRAVLRIEIDKLQLPDRQRYVYRVKTSLSAETYLQIEPPHLFKMDVWIMCGTASGSSVRENMQAIARLAAGHVGGFINDYFAANPRKRRSPDSDSDVNNPVKPTDKSQTTSETARFKYVSSKNSKVFHASDCIWVTRISAKNLVSYRTREQAVNDGKRPCKTCKP